MTEEAPLTSFSDLPSAIARLEDGRDTRKPWRSSKGRARPSFATVMDDEMGFVD